MSTREIRIATRKSLLALWQANYVKARLEHFHPGLTVELVYGHAIKPTPRIKVEAEARVSLQDMKRMIRQGDKPG